MRVCTNYHFIAFVSYFKNILSWQQNYFIEPTTISLREQRNFLKPTKKLPLASKISKQSSLGVIKLLLHKYQQNDFVGSWFAIPNKILSTQQTVGFTERMRVYTNSYFIAFIPIMKNILSWQQNYFTEPTTILLCGQRNFLKATKRLPLASKISKQSSLGATKLLLHKYQQNDFVGSWFAIPNKILSTQQNCWVYRANARVY